MFSTFEVLDRAMNTIKSKITFTFDNVEDMKNSDYLHEGMSVKTLGYYEKLDGGGACYYIDKKKDSDVNNECDTFIVGYQKDLVARFYSLNGSLNVLQFGVVQKSTPYDIKFNEERIKYCEDFCVDKGLSITYPNRFVYRSVVRERTAFCSGIVVSKSSSLLKVKFSLPIPDGVLNQPVQRGIILRGQFTIYSVSGSTKEGVFSVSNHSAFYNGLSIISELTLDGSFDEWVENSPVTVYVSLSNMEYRNVLVS